MLLDTDFDKFFADTVNVLKPYINDVVCVGGCASALYRYHAHASDIEWGYLGTGDVDIGVPSSLPCNDRPPVAELMTNIGFKELTCGDAAEAVIKYGPEEEGSPVDLEFLCSKAGLNKDDQRRAAYSVQEGLYAQPLRYLELSMNNTWNISMGSIPGFEELMGVSVRVPNPTAYVVSKVLIREEGRRPASMMKDCFYIYEVSVIFRDALDEIRHEYDRLSPCTPKWKKRFCRDARVLFGSDTAEGPISAVQVFKDMGDVQRGGFDVTEELVFRSVNRFLDALVD